MLLYQGICFPSTLFLYALAVMSTSDIIAAVLATITVYMMAPDTMLVMTIHSSTSSKNQNKTSGIKRSINCALLLLNDKLAYC